MTKAQLIAKYPGAPEAFIDAFLNSGYALSHFLPMRLAWQEAMSRAVELTRKWPIAPGIHWDLRKEM